MPSVRSGIRRQPWKARNSAPGCSNPAFSSSPTTSSDYSPFSPSRFSIPDEDDDGFPESPLKRKMPNRREATNTRITNWARKDTRVDEDLDDDEHFTKDEDASGSDSESKKSENEGDGGYILSSFGDMTDPLAIPGRKNYDNRAMPTLLKPPLPSKRRYGYCVYDPPTFSRSPYNRLRSSQAYSEEFHSLLESSRSSRSSSPASSYCGSVYTTPVKSGQNSRRGTPGSATSSYASSSVSRSSRRRLAETDSYGGDWTNSPMPSSPLSGRGGAVSSLSGSPVAKRARTRPPLPSWDD
ncbi:hypothetical protein C8Q75DRAFT_809042 [Abortiporus biennis]|nr:hypothetical protein C8Q75DRAFT_809042 [Abortiporus biennis]